MILFHKISFNYMYVLDVINAAYLQGHMSNGNVTKIMFNIGYISDKLMKEKLVLPLLPSLIFASYQLVPPIRRIVTSQT